MNKVFGRDLKTEYEAGDLYYPLVNFTSEDGTDNSKFKVPGRTIILEQNKKDMGAHSFTFAEKNIVIAATDFPDYDDRKKTSDAKIHYSKIRKDSIVYGVAGLYVDRNITFGARISFRKI